MATTALSQRLWGPLLAVLTFSTPAISNAQPGRISTYAGGGPTTTSATTSSLATPSGVAVAGNGDVYVSSSAWNAVFKLSGSTLTLVAGTPGISGFGGDGGAATSAKLSGPSGVALDTNGNLYIADSSNCRVRKVSPAGTITTIAGGGLSQYSIGDGGPATSAYLCPGSVALDSTGSIYVADTINRRIRKVEASTGVVSTIVGDTSSPPTEDGGLALGAWLGAPVGIAVDAANNLFIADRNQMRIRKVTASTGIISTVAGDGSAGFHDDNGLATSAGLNAPSSIAVDDAGNLYIGDTNNNRIRKVTAATGIISTLAGSSFAGYCGDGGFAASACLNSPHGAAVDSAGNVYIADSLNQRLRKVAASTNLISTVTGGGIGSPQDLATAIGLQSPNGVALDAGGNLYIADTSNRLVRKVSANTGTISTVAGNGTATAVDNVPATNSGLGKPVSVAVSSNGDLYIVDYDLNTVRKVSAATGVISTVVGNGTAGASLDGFPAAGASLQLPISVAIDHAGNLYIAEQGTGTIRKVTLATGLLTTVAGTNYTSLFNGTSGPALSINLWMPTSIALDANDNLYLCDYGHNMVRKVSAATGILTTIAGSDAFNASYSGDGAPARLAGLSSPLSIALDSSGNLYIADQSGTRIRRVTAGSGIITTIAGNGTPRTSGDGGPAASAGFGDVRALAADSSGNIYLADTFNSRIRKIEAFGPTTTTLTSNANPNTAAQLSITAAVLPPSATGTVQFSDGANVIAVLPLVNGTATLSNLTSFALGTHTLTALYLGDATYQYSNSNTLNQAIALTTTGINDPAVAAVTPAASTGTTQTISFQFSSPLGFQALAVENVLINNYLDARQACYLAYAGSTNVLYIVPDNGDAAQLSGKVMDGTGVLQNSQCTIDVAGSSVSSSGNTLTITLKISFAKPGNRVIYAAARDSYGRNSGWQTVGTVNVPGGSTTYPRAVGVSPGSGAGANAVLTFTFQDATSVNNLQTAWGLINFAIDARYACYFAYYVLGNQLYLYPDNGNGAQATNISLTGTNSISNSLCTISADGASVIKSGTTLTLTLPITFKAPFSGFKGIWLATQTLPYGTPARSDISAWESMGAWRVP